MDTLFMIANTAQELLWPGGGQVGLGFVLYAIFAVSGALGVIYALYLGFMLGKAEDEGKRQKAKQRIVNVIFSLFVILVLTILLTTSPQWLR